VARLREQLHAFEQEHRIHGLLHVSEVYDGDPPHRPGGAIAQSWNTAELIRAFAMLDGRGNTGFARARRPDAGVPGRPASVESSPSLEARPEQDPDR
jgi:glycogen debranching enzyme